MIEIFLAFSHHALPGNWHEVHPGARYNFDNNIDVGIYQNSESGLSAYGAYDFDWIEIGLVTGYDAVPVMPFVRVKYETDNLTFFAAPAVKDTHEVGVVFGVEFKIPVK